MKALVLATGILATVGLASPDIRELFRPAAPWWKPKLSYPKEDMHVDQGFMKQLCADNRDSSRTMCDGFISAVAEAMAKGSVQGFRACVPVDEAPSDVVNDVRRQLARIEHPAGYSGSSVVAQALSEAFPCWPTSSRPRKEIYLFTGDIQRECANGSDSRLVCEGFVLAVADMLGFGPVHGIEACFPHPQDAIYAKVRKALSAPLLRWDEVLGPASWTVARILAAPHLCPK